MEPETAEQSLCRWQNTGSALSRGHPAHSEASRAGQPRAFPLSIRVRYRGSGDEIYVRPR